MASSRLVSVLSLTAAVVWWSFRFASRAAGSAGLTQPLRRDAMAQHRAVSRRANEGGGRSSEPAVHLLHRHGERRRVEDDRCRAHLEADLRGSAHGIHRLGRGRARPIPTSSTSAAAKACLGPTSPSATASTSRPTRARPGRTSVFAIRSRFPRLPSTPRIRTASSSPRSGIRTGPTRSAGSFARRTAGRRSIASSSRTRTPAARTSTSIHPTHRSSTRRSGNSGRVRGRTPRGTARMAASSSPPTAARPGRR